MTIRDGALVLADGSVFEGELIGAFGPDGGVAGSGEVVFNTARTERSRSSEVEGSTLNSQPNL